MAEKLYQSKIATLPLFLQYRKGDRKCIDFFSIIYYKVVNVRFTSKIKIFQMNAKVFHNNSNGDITEEADSVSL